MISLKRIRELSKIDSEHGKRVRIWLNRFDTTSSTDDRSPQSDDTKLFTTWLLHNVFSSVSDGSRRSYLTSIRKVTECDSFMSALSNESKGLPSPSSPKRPKSKSISWQEFAIIESYLKQISETPHSDVADWLRSTILAGLRPSEWAQASIINSIDGLVLRAPNTTKAEATPQGDDYDIDEYRLIPLTNLDPADLNCLRRHLERALLNAALGEFEQWYNSVRLKLYNISKLCFQDKPRINLYSARHQYCANLKSAGYSPTTIGYLMGHKNTKTSRHSYGAKRHGSMSGIDTSATEALVSAFQGIFDDED